MCLKIHHTYKIVKQYLGCVVKHIFNYIILNIIYRSRSVIVSETLNLTSCTMDNDLQ